MDNVYEIEVASTLSPQEAAREVPRIITTSVDSLKKIQSKISETRKQANNAKDQAMSAWRVEVGFWHRTTPALEALQRAGKSQSEALVGISEGQELLFAQQCILAQLTKNLFMLCMENKARALIAVKQIRAQLQGASQEEISDIARNEMQKTIQQLKRQIDIIEQQERLQNKVNSLENELGDTRKKLEKKFAQSENGQILKKVRGIYVSFIIMLFFLLCFCLGFAYFFVLSNPSSVSGNQASNPLFKNTNQTESSSIQPSTSGESDLRIEFGQPRQESSEEQLIF